MGKTQGRVSPHDLEAEKSVLGAMLLDDEALFIATKMLGVEDFYMLGHGDIFEAMRSLFSENKPVDHITLSDELNSRGQLDAVGGVSYLAELSNAVGLVAHVKSYCEIVKEKSILRQLIHNSNITLEDAFQEQKEAAVILNEAEQNIFHLSQKQMEKGLRHIGGIVGEAFTKMQELSQKAGGLTGITTGFVDLDQSLSGLQASDLILLAARPSMGKTALGINIATNAAIRGKGKVAIFSLEMSDLQLSQRIISSLAKVNLQKIISGNLESKDWQQVAEAAAAIRGLDIFIDDTSGISLTELRSKCRRLKIEQGLDLIVIDYLQLMSSDGRQESRQQEISTISRGLKALAKEIECPVLALSQLSRLPETRADKHPMLSDLRDSGAIEQDADVVMFIYREDYYNEKSELSNIAEIIIAKHRNGPTGSVQMVFLPEITTFADKAREIV